jgi:hypothetical protein
MHGTASPSVDPFVELRGIKPYEMADSDERDLSIGNEPAELTRGDPE